MYQRLGDCRDDGTFGRVLERLHVRLNQEGLIDLDTSMIDSTAVVQPEPLLVPGKKGARRTDRSCVGAQPTKIHLICDANGIPLRFMLSPGQVSDIAHVQPLLDQARIPGKPDRPRKRCRWLLADKGYDAGHLRQYCDRYA